MVAQKLNRMRRRPPERRPWEKTSPAFDLINAQFDGRLRDSMCSASLAALHRIEGPGEWTLDMAISKAVRIAESTNFQLRLDANNILNHPVPSYQSFGSGVRIIVAQPPVVDINSTNPFGYLDNKVGTRTFQVTARLNF